MSEIDANIIVDGQKTVATIPQEGEIVKDGGEIDATCIVEDSNGKKQLAVKIVNVDDEPADKSEIDAQILNNNNELITVTEEQEGEVITQDNGEIDLHCLVQKDDGKQLAVKTVELDGEIIKTGGAIDTTCLVQGSNGKKQLAVKVFKTGGGEIIETVYGTNSITLPKAKANGLKSVKLFGGCEQSGTPTPDTPQDIVSNNGVLKYSANMANVNEQTVLLGYYISAQGVVTADANNWIYQPFIPVKPNTTYTLSMSSPVYYVTISEYSTADDSGFVIRKAGVSGSNTSLTITTGATTNYVRFGTNIRREVVTLDAVLAIEWMLNVGNSMPYQPYVEGSIYTDGTIETVTDNLGNVATAEMLLKVGDYQDVQSVLDGQVTRNIGVKVFDGTENWTANTVSSGRLVFYVTKTSIGSDSTVLPNGSSNIKCSHFETSTAAAQSLYGTVWAGGTAINFTAGDFCANLAAWRQWLANQYAAGTPVIIIYPLATPTTETVTGQILTTKKGTNTISITQASISSLDLEAKYKKSI